MLFPITFSIPEEKILKTIPKKDKILSRLIPGKVGTYIYNNEEDYYNQYKESYFAITTKKAGWDCLRHYEILANGCIPYFIDIENCPKDTLNIFPKELIIEAIKMYPKFKSIKELTKETIDDYNILLLKLINYTINNLTTNKIARYILQKTNYENVSKILYLSGNLDPDYLRCLTLHGFKELFGNKCHDYPKVSHIYKDPNIDFKSLYGKGITYTNLLNLDLHDDNLDNNIEEHIKNKYFDIVIYGSYHRGMPFYDLVYKTYNQNEIILLCGQDIHSCDYNDYLSKGHHLFVREL